MQIAVTEVIALLERHGGEATLAVLKAQQVGYEQGLKAARARVNNVYGLTEAQMITVLAYLYRGHMIEAIRYVRSEQPLGLREGKDLVERIAQEHRLLRWA